MVAQGSSSSGAEVFAILLALGVVVALQIYLIYAIIATRQDVRTIRQHLQGGAISPTGAGQSIPRGNPGAFRAEDVERLQQAADLHKSGVLTEDEFGRVKEGILGSWVPHAPVTSEPSGWQPSLYSVVIRDLGSADPARVAKIIRSHLGDFPAERLQTTPCLVADGIGYATADQFARISSRRAHRSNAGKVGQRGGDHHGRETGIRNLGLDPRAIR
jgi:hypothetical protein